MHEGGLRCKPAGCRCFRQLQAGGEDRKGPDGSDETLGRGRAKSPTKAEGRKRHPVAG
jgi:hypothetical protein